MRIDQVGPMEGIRIIKSLREMFDTSTGTAGGVEDEFGFELGVDEWYVMVGQKDETVSFELGPGGGVPGLVTREEPVSEVDVEEDLPGILYDLFDRADEIDYDEALEKTISWWENADLTEGASREDFEEEFDLPDPPDLSDVELESIDLP